MSSMVLSVVNLAAGSFFDNVCDHVANRLKHGDCIDEKCRQLVVRELDEIKTKLDGLARKDLQTSICFLKDGLYLLNCIFEDAASESENDATENKLAHVKECLVIDGKGDLPWKQPDETLKSEIAILNKALSRSSQTLTVEASERFVNAKLSFENAYLKATEAFTNEALSTTERILATKLRVVSKILHCLEDPVMAIAFCKLYLQQLHELPAVKKRFSVFFRSHVKSRLSKKKRGNNIRCVMELNYALYEYTKLFAKTSVEILRCWPKINLGKSAFNPMLVHNKVLKKMLKSGLRSPNQFLFDDFDCSECIAVNSRGELIAKCNDGKGLRLLSTEKIILGSFCFDTKDTEIDSFEVLDLAVTLDDVVYAVTRYKKADAFNYKLYVFDANLDHVEQQVSLGCLTGPGESHHSVCIAVDANRNVLVSKQDDAKVFFFDHNGEAQNSFTMRGWNLIKDLGVSARGEVVAAELVGKTVSIYAENGELSQEITMPDLHKVCELAIDYIEDEIVVLAEVLTGSFHEQRLLSYSGCGELLRTLVLPRQKGTAGYRITSHPSGSFVVVHKTGVIFLH